MSGKVVSACALTSKPSTLQYVADDGPVWITPACANLSNLSMAKASGQANTDPMLRPSEQQQEWRPIRFARVQKGASYRRNHVCVTLPFTKVVLPLQLPIVNNEVGIGLVGKEKGRGRL
jgi:hypothetical protein